MNKYTYLLFTLILSVCSVKAQNTMIKAEPLPNTINKPDTDELAPVVSKDGKTMFFVRGRKETDLAKKEKIGQDIYFSTLENGNWTEAKKVEGKINNKSHNVVCGINDKGDRLYLSNTYINEKGKMHRGVSISQKEGNEWGKPQDIEIDELEDVDINKNSHFYFFMAKDESYIIISKHEENSKGEEDLYYSLKTDKVSKKTGLNIYSKPDSLGKINSKGYETSPYMIDDDMTLVFASNRGSTNPHNHSEGRIYFSTRQDKKDWTSWSEPQLIGEYNKENKDWAVLNSEGKFDAYWFPHDDVKDGKMEYCYFVSDRSGGQGAADIWKLNVSYQLKVNVYACDENGKQTKVKVPAKITIEGLEADMKGDTLTFLKASFDKPYRLKAVPEDGKKYRPYDGEITITAKDYKNEDANRFFTSKDICLTPIPPKVDSALILTKVYFLFDKYAMNETVTWAKAENESITDKNLMKSSFLGTGADTLKRIIEFLNTDKGAEYEIKVVGYADSIGTVKKNILLSRNRTNTIKQFLVKNGLDEKRILPTEIKIPATRINDKDEMNDKATKETIEILKQTKGLGEGDVILSEYGLGEASHILVNGGINDEARRQQRRVEIQAFKKKIVN